MQAIQILQDLITDGCKSEDIRNQIRFLENHPEMVTGLTGEDLWYFLGLLQHVIEEDRVEQVWESALNIVGFCCERVKTAEDTKTCRRWSYLRNSLVLFTSACRRARS